MLSSVIANAEHIGRELAAVLRPSGHLTPGLIIRDALTVSLPRAHLPDLGAQPGPRGAGAGNGGDAVRFPWIPTWRKSVSQCPAYNPGRGALGCAGQVPARPWARPRPPIGEARSWSPEGSPRFLPPARSMGQSPGSFSDTLLLPGLF